MKFVRMRTEKRVEFLAILILFSLWETDLGSFEWNYILRFHRNPPQMKIVRKRTEKYVEFLAILILFSLRETDLGIF